MIYEEIRRFSRDLKKLKKKFPSLPEDLEINKQYRISLFHENQGDRKSIVEIRGVGNTSELRFFKVRRFQCKSLKGRGSRSGIRVIYAYLPKESRIIFIEIYFKSDQENERRERVIDLIKLLQMHLGS